MVLSDDIGEFMKDAVFIQPVSGEGLYGPTFGEGANYPCFIKRSIKAIKTRDGKDAVSSCQIFVDPAVIGYEDKITIDNDSPPILRIENHADENREAYSTVIFT
jgi:hypothetical protein